MRPPTKEGQVNPKIMKLIVKGALGLAVSATIGTMIKTEKNIGVHIDEYFNSKVSSTSN